MLLLAILVPGVPITAAVWCYSKCTITAVIGTLVYGHIHYECNHCTNIKLITTGTSQEDIIIALGSVSGILAIAICVLFIIILCLCCCKEKLCQCMERCRCRLIGECCKCKQRHRDYQQIHEQQGANITNVLESNVQMQHECINTEHAYNIIPI